MPEPGTGERWTGRGREHERPDNFSTYTPRGTVRRLKVIAAIHDVPLWAIVTEALEQYLERYEREHGQLPRGGRSTSGRPAGRS